MDVAVTAAERALRAESAWYLGRALSDQRMMTAARLSYREALRDLRAARPPITMRRLNQIRHDLRARALAER
jgi:hypothetical protein